MAPCMVRPMYAANFVRNTGQAALVPSKSSGAHLDTPAAPPPLKPPSAEELLDVSLGSSSALRAFRSVKSLSAVADLSARSLLLAVSACI